MEELGGVDKVLQPQLTRWFVNDTLLLQYKPGFIIWHGKNNYTMKKKWKKKKGIEEAKFIL